VAGGLHRHDRVKITQIGYDPTNWLATSIYLAFVGLIALACVSCGRAIEALSAGDVTPISVEEVEDPFGAGW
jgi:hypothetical protein